jgi:DNA-binding CsgD family transcriptional regulator
MDPDENPLIEHEIQTLRMLAGGLTNRQIATREGVTPTAVANRVARAARKLGTTTKTNTVLVAFARGYLNKPGGASHEVSRVQVDETSGVEAEGAGGAEASG